MFMGSKSFLTKNLTKGSLTTAWILMMIILAIGFIGETFIPDIKLPSLILGFILLISGIVAVLESFFEGEKLSLSGLTKTPPMDILGLLMAGISLTLGFGFLFNITVILGLLGNFTGGILFTLMILLLIEGIANRR